MSDKKKSSPAQQHKTKNMWIGIGAAGVGSAALAAAVLYTSRAKPKSAVQPKLSEKAENAED